MSKSFIAEHSIDPIESIVISPENKIVFRAYLKDGLIKKIYYDWLSRNEFETQIKKSYNSESEAIEDIKKSADRYSIKRNNLIKKISNDTHGYWIREVNDKKKVYYRVYSIPDDNGFSIFRLKLINANNFSFNENNPKLIDKVNSKKEAEEILKSEIDKIYYSIY